jgi:hypothetical protein
MNILLFRQVSYFRQSFDLKFLPSVRLIRGLRSVYGVLFVLLVRVISYANLTGCFSAVLGAYTENKTALASGIAEIRNDRGFDVWCGVVVRPCNMEKRVN